MKQESDIPPFPSDMPVDERVYVLDQSLAEEKTPEGIINGTTPTYTLESVVHNVEQSSSVVIRVLRNDNRKGGYGSIAPEIQARQYETLLARIEGWRFDGGKTPKKKVAQQIFFVRHFREGKGYIVDEGEKSEVVVQRMRAYEQRIARYHPLVPKAFFIEKIGTTAALPAELMVHYAEEYRQRLEQIQGNGARLSPEEQNYLVDQIQQLTKTSQVKSNPPHLRDDGRLVALAYALPAKQVTVYSHDRDIKALVMLTRHLAPERDVDTVFLRQ
ncbi:MAG: hypothetical protein Q7R76_01200 [Candidatus Woesearchaeota archaeon]|nr:hypothetical protein [Candidatus Woesearchaeota archaeon]